MKETQSNTILLQYLIISTATLFCDCLLKRAIFVTYMYK